MKQGGKTLATAQKAIWVGLIALALAGCERGSPELMNVRSNTGGPDEFTILPSKPLETPTTFAELPEPTPGGSNRTDQRPLSDAVAALGGNPGRLATDGASPDTALLAQTDRFGRETGIRSELAQRDAEFRQRNRGLFLERAFNLTVYYQAYRRQSLDRYAELERLRKLGIKTPSAPPDTAADN
ncbi:MAG: DUF3035 domain-containing protein [Pseudomonadota bacterium]